MSPRDPRRTLILRLRRRVRVETRFDVKEVGECLEEQTCRECGHKILMAHKTLPSFAKKMIAYRRRGGVTGVCPRCSKRAAQERYPLPEEDT